MFLNGLSGLSGFDLQWVPDIVSQCQAKQSLVTLDSAKSHQNSIGLELIPDG